jgi:hypothetical protein
VERDGRHRGPAGGVAKGGGNWGRPGAGQGRPSWDGRRPMVLRVGQAWAEGAAERRREASVRETVESGR